MGNGNMLKSLHQENLQDDFYLPILQSIGACVYLIDRDFQIHWTNIADVKCGNPSLPGIKGKRCYEVHFRRAAPCSDCPVRQVFASHRPYTVERWLSWPDGSHKFVEVRVYPVYDKRGNAAYAFKMGFDVTEKKLAGEKHAQYVEALETSLRDRIEGQCPSSHSDSLDTKNRFSLSNRELQVLRLMAEGFSNLEISGHLSISPHTVKTHVVHIFNKIGVTDRTQAAVLATRIGII